MTVNCCVVRLCTFIVIGLHPMLVYGTLSGLKSGGFDSLHHHLAWHHRQDMQLAGVYQHFIE